MPLGHRSAVIIAGIGLWTACLNFDPFSCADDSQCDLDAQSGVCSGGFCSYPDTACPSGLRYEANAGNGLGGTCVGGDTASATETNTSGGTDTVQPDTDSVSTTASTTVTTGPTGGETEGQCGGGGQPCCGGECDAGLECMGSGCGCVSAIEAGATHTCAIKLDGSVWCWGDNDQRQLGIAASDEEPTPVMVPDIGGDAVAISAWSQTCALRDDDIVACWGANGLGQADPMDPELSIPAAEASWAMPATLVAAGGEHTCVGRSDGTVASCWGANDVGQLTTADPGPGPVHIPGIFELQQLDLGLEHACGVTTSGELWCWGDNSQGQLGADPATLPSSPSLVQVSLPPVAEVAVGRRHSCARVGAEIHCWGLNTAGQLGDGTGVSGFTPVVVALPPRVSVDTIASGHDHTCVITQSDELYCWGSNDDGELMLEPDKNGIDMYTFTPRKIEVGAGVLAFTGGGTQSCAIVDTGEVLCWGRNQNGEIGDGGTGYAHTPTPVALQCP